MTPRPYTFTDLYKLTMKQVVWQKFPNAWVRYHYKCRSKGVDLRPLIPKIRARIEQLNGLGPTDQELGFLFRQGYFGPSFMAALGHFKLNTDFVTVSEKDGEFDLVVEGPWYDTIDFEVPLLSIISECYFEDQATPETFVEGRKRLTEKIEELWRIYEEWEHLPDRDGRQPNQYRLSEFGTRRAFSSEWLEEVVDTLSNSLPSDLFSGTSNVYLAMKYDLTPQGTMAHEYISAHGALYPLQDAQRMALYNWNDVYRGRLGTALSDTFTFAQFLRDFDLALAMLYTGARHDSGDPFDWGRSLVDHYRKLMIDPYFKVAVWTDSLDIPLSHRLWRYFCYDIKTGFGIGTNLTNDLGPTALSQVIKMTHLNGMPLIKISDEPAKAMCEDEQFKNWAVHYFTEVACRP